MFVSGGEVGGVGGEGEGGGERGQGGGEMGQGGGVGEEMTGDIRTRLDREDDPDGRLDKSSMEIEGLPPSPSSHPLLSSPSPPKFTCSLDP